MRNGHSRFRDAGFALLCLLSVAAIPLGQLASLIAFDTTGFDQYIPGILIYTVFPALLLTVVPVLVAVRLYPRNRAVLYAAAVFVASVAVSLVTVNFFVIG